MMKISEFRRFCIFVKNRMCEKYYKGKTFCILALNKMLKMKYKVIYLHIADLFLPFEGYITAGQYILVSRILDIESANQGGGGSEIEFRWQTRLTECVNKKKQSYEEKKKSDLYFKKIIDSMSEYGFNPYISALGLASVPLLFNDGSHRLAYLFCKDYNAYVPVQIRSLKPWFPLDGYAYWKNKGLTLDELSELNDRYGKILTTEIHSQISGFIKAKLLTENVISLIKEYADFQIYEKIQKVNKRLITQGKVVASFHNEDVVIFRMHPIKQSMYYHHGSIRSKYFDELNIKISKVLHTKKWGYVAATVTESLELECLLIYKGKSL